MKRLAKAVTVKWLNDHRPSIGFYIGKNPWDNELLENEIEELKTTIGYRDCQIRALKQCRQEAIDEAHRSAAVNARNAAAKMDELEARLNEANKQLYVEARDKERRGVERVIQNLAMQKEELHRGVAYWKQCAKDNTQQAADFFNLIKKELGMEESAPWSEVLTKIKGLVSDIKERRKNHNRLLETYRLECNAHSADVFTVCEKLTTAEDRIEELEAFARDIRDNYDCDTTGYQEFEAHRESQCRSCQGKKLLLKKES